MRKIGGLLLIFMLGLTGCSATNAADPASSAPAAESGNSSRIAPLVAIPSESATPTPSASLPPEFYDDSARGRYLAGVKKALNAWRDGVIPSDDDLLKGAEVACGLFAAGKSREDIADMAGPNEIAKDNAAAVASFASRELCTAYNTFR
jgi:hypothetical protein